MQCVSDVQFMIAKKRNSSPPIDVSSAARDTTTDDRGDNQRTHCDMRLAQGGRSHNLVRGSINRRAGTGPAPRPRMTYTSVDTAHTPETHTGTPGASVCV